MNARIDSTDPRLFWAKLNRERPGEYHPLLCHLLDVGAVTRALWAGVLPPALRARLAASLGVGVEEAGAWIAFWAAAHDIGKLSPAFQRRDPAAVARFRAAGFPLPRLPGAARHGTISARVLGEALVSQFGLAPALARRVATVIGGHHGVFPSTSEVNILSAEADLGRSPWPEARLALLDSVAATLGQPLPPPGGALDNPAALILAGLISVADWIGSNAQFFDFQVKDPAAPPPIDPSAYWDHAQEQAARALTQLGWPAPPPTTPLRFGELFPHLTRPAPVQRAVVEIGDALSGPGLVIVEAPMGEGKTEAALYLADRWGAELGQRGFYVALPTQATSNQMFGRVREFLHARYGSAAVDLQLLHGHAELSAEFAALRQAADAYFVPADVHGLDSHDRAPPGVVAAEWFTYRKRGLLGPFGVGTIDQGLLAVLQTRHVFVRLFGLAQKTIVIDEVHAYDAYMSTLLEQLLTWAAALGSSVVLLSATLPRGRRDALLSAYAAGLGRAAPTADLDAPYPRVSWLDASQAGAISVGVSARATKAVALRRESARLPTAPGEPFPLGEQLQAALAAGGCAVVIANTVRRAQEIYRALEPYFPGLADDGEPELDLLHARFLFGERDRREKRALRRFGKPGATVPLPVGGGAPVRRPHRAVLVSTQIVEQSLDLDFDLMVTDLAPADLILQRSGRLWRHERSARPPLAGAAGPELWILWPEAGGDGVPRFDPGSAAVYDPHILLRSWLALAGRRSLAVPDDVEALIEAVYDGRSPPPDLPPALHAAWEEGRANREREIESERREAQERWLKRPGYAGALYEFTQNPREEDAPDFHRAHQALTRLSEPTVAVVCLYDGPGAYPSLDPAGGAPVDPRAVPDLALTRSLLERSVSVSDKSVVYTLQGLPAPPGWVRSGHLRHHRLIRLDPSGRVSEPDLPIRLDPALGLVVERPAKE